MSFGHQKHVKTIKSMSSDSSSSDSEISGDEEFDNNILKAFQAVKCNLNSAGFKRNEEISPLSFGKHKNPASRQKTSSSLQHRLIYQTFQKDDVNKKSNGKSSDNQSPKKSTKILKKSSKQKSLKKANKKTPWKSCDKTNETAHRIMYNIANIGERVGSDTENRETSNENACDLTDSDYDNQEYDWENKADTDLDIDDNQEHGKMCNRPKQTADDLGSFFIDKGPSCVAQSTDKIADGAVVYDFTNIEENVDSDSENVVAFDLTNIEDPSTNAVTCNSAVSDTNAEDFQSKINLDENGRVNKERFKKEGKKKKRQDVDHLSSRLEADIEVKDVYIDVDPLSKSASRKMVSMQQRHKEPEIMKKSVITDDFERQDSIQTTHISVRQQKKQRRLEREKTKGDKWFNMPATELTDERKYDLQVIQMRKALDPKRFYKAHDLKSAPKYFQFGQVVEDATDFYSSRVPKKQRKSTVVEELLADAEFRKFNKRKYEEVQDAKRHGKGPYKHMKRLKKRKK